MNLHKSSAALFLYVVIPGLLIFAVVAVLNHYIYQRESEFYRNVYVNEVAGIRTLVEERFQSAMIAAESTSAFFSSSEDVTLEEFNRFASILSNNISAGAIALPITLEWIDAYNNIRFVYPMNEVNAKIVGLDLNQYPNRLLPIEKSKATRATVVTEPIMLAQGYPGLLLYSPIYKDETYFGQAVVVIRLKDLLANTPGTTPIYNKNEYIQTGNFIIPFDDDIVLNNNGERITNPQGDAVKDPIASTYSSTTSGVLSDTIKFADKTWQVKSQPTYLSRVNREVGAYIGFSVSFVLSIILFLWLLHRRRQRILNEKARADALISSIGDGLVACDKNGIITFANKKAGELSGFSVQESLGKSYYDVWHIIDSKGVAIPTEKRLFYRALAKKEIVSVSVSDHLFIVKKNGSRFPLASTIAPILVDGSIEGAIVVFRDITKESEVDRMKTEFLSLATHQLLSPSSSIKWLAELLEAGDYGALKKRQMEAVRSIRQSNDNMIGLINSLLNVSRLESGRIIVEPKPSKLNELVRAVAKELEPEIKKKQHKFQLKASARLPKINIDPRLVSQVYKNLLTNAIKYTPAKGRISVTISQVNKDLVSVVSDNGYGIPVGDQGRVFEKFFRAENIATIVKDGNGLGLYLVKQIVEVSGGKIWFKSEIDQGTDFSFSLPLAGSKPKAGEVTIT